MHCVVPGGGALEATTGGVEGSGAGQTRGGHVCGAACVDPRQITDSCPLMHPHSHPAATGPDQANETVARAIAIKFRISLPRLAGTRITNHNLACHCLVTLTDAVVAFPLASSARAEIVELLLLPLALGTLQL